MGELEVSEREEKDVTIVEFAGNITMQAGISVLREVFRRLQAEDKKKVLLNFADVTRFDAEALGELVETYSTVSKAGGQLKLLNLTQKIQDLIIITKLLTVFDVYDSEQEALSSFDTPPIEIAKAEPPSDYLNNFFPISSELALRIATTNSELVMSELESVEDEDINEKGLEQAEDFDHLERDSAEHLEVADRESSPDEDLQDYQRTIRERLYEFLAFLARSEHARNGEPYELFEILPPGITTLFGLEDPTDHTYDLPILVTREFRKWLIDNNRYYEAPWGEIRLEDGDLLRLTAAALPDHGSGRAYSRAVHSFSRPEKRTR